MAQLTSKQLLNFFNLIPMEQNILIIGKHGIGKSDIVDDYYSKLMPVEKLFLGQMGDPGDLIGIPTVSQDYYEDSDNAAETAKAVMLFSEKKYKEACATYIKILENIENKKKQSSTKTEFAPPKWWPVDDKPICLFLDELNRANQALLSAVMDLTLNRKLMGRALPAGSIVVSAINEGDQYQVTQLDAALYNRFNIVNLVVSSGDWLEWARNNNLHPDVISFISGKPDLLFYSGEAQAQQTATPRSWHRLSNVMKKIEASGLKIDPKDFTFQNAVESMIGKTASTAFLEFLSSIIKITANDVLDRYNEVAKKIQWSDAVRLSTLADECFESVNAYLQNNEASGEKWDKMFKNFDKFCHDVHDKTGGDDSEILCAIVNNKIEMTALDHYGKKVLDNPAYEKHTDFITDHIGISEARLAKESEEEEAKEEQKGTKE